ncbi:hypothetical protein HDR58_05210 [bacterium]|nr:hypothetical protein [bacterium]
MRIQSINTNFSYIVSKKNSPSFGSTDRFYVREDGKEIGNNTWLFREDLPWHELAEFEIGHFKDKEKVNIIQFASSDGSEGYTKIISLLENPKRKNVDKFFPIQAYDIDNYIVHKAQGGEIALSERDFYRLANNSISLSKYFSRIATSYDDYLYDVYRRDILSEKQAVTLPGNFNVSDNLRDKIVFQLGDMFEILPKIKDNSNTILMCRNILGYFADNDAKIEEFVQTAGKVLKRGSLFTIGKIDTTFTNIESLLNKNNFLKMMNNVFLKI